MAMETSGLSSLVNQEIQMNKAQTGFDVLTKTSEKTEQMQANEELRLQIAEQTGKGLHLDVTA